MTIIIFISKQYYRKSVENNLEEKICFVGNIYAFKSEWCLQSIKYYLLIQNPLYTLKAGAFLRNKFVGSRHILLENKIQNKMSLVQWLWSTNTIKKLMSCKYELTKTFHSIIQFFEEYKIPQQQNKIEFHWKLLIAFILLNIISSTHSSQLCCAEITSPAEDLSERYISLQDILSSDCIPVQPSDLCVDQIRERSGSLYIQLEENTRGKDNKNSWQSIWQTSHTLDPNNCGWYFQSSPYVASFVLMTLKLISADVQRRVDGIIVI